MKKLTLFAALLFCLGAAVDDNYTLPSGSNVLTVEPLQEPYLIVATNGSDSTGDGSLANPYRNPEHAMEVADPGDTIYVRSGTYYDHDGDNGVVRLSANGGGTTNNYKYLKAFPGQFPVLDGQNTARSTVYLTPSQWVWIEGFEITRGYLDGVDLAWAGYVGGYSHHVVIKDNIIHNNGTLLVANCSDADGRSGIFSNIRTSYLTIDSNYIHTNGRTPNIPCDSDPSSGLHQYKHDHGLYVGGKYLTIINNVLENHYAGWHFRPDGFAKVTPEGAVAYTEAADDEYTMTVVNNTFGPNTNPNPTSTAPYPAGVARMSVNCAQEYPTLCGGSGTQSWGQNVDLSNNIFLDMGVYKPTEGAWVIGDIGLLPNPYLYMSENQRCYNNVIQTPTNGVLTTGCTTQYATNAIWIDEKNSKINQSLASFNFFDAANSDYRIQAGSSAENHGDASIAPAYDKDGNPRGNPPDVGAYEVQ